MSYRLFIDDERHPIDGDFIVVRSFDAAVDYVLRHGTPYYVQFDHDLGHGKNGLDFAKWLVDRSLDGFGFPKGYGVHSQNPVGRDNIKSIMDGYYRWLN